MRYEHDLAHQRLCMNSELVGSCIDRSLPFLMTPPSTSLILANPATLQYPIVHYVHFSCVFNPILYASR